MQEWSGRVGPAAVWDTGCVSMRLSAAVAGGTEPEVAHGRGAGSSASRPTADPRAAWIAPVLVALPVVVALVSTIGRPWWPTGDQALELLRTHDVGGAHTPLVGAYSRFGWDHPGPLLFWLSAPAYRVFGPTGMVATVAAINAASAAGAVVAARRFGGNVLAWLIAAGLAVMVHSQGARQLVETWNPAVGTLPLFAYLLFVLGAAAGDRATLVPAIIAGSYAVQAHVSSAPVVLVAAIAGVSYRFVSRQRATKPLTVERSSTSSSLPPAPSRRLTLIVAAVVALAAWFGSLVQQVTGHPGNLTAILRFFRQRHASTGWSLAQRIGARQFGLPAPWMGASEQNVYGTIRTSSMLPAAVIIVLFAVVALLAACRGRRNVGFLIGFGLVLEITCVVAISHTVGGVFVYFIRWTWPVAALTWAGALWGLCVLVRRRAVTVVLVRLAAVVAIVASLVTSFDALHVALPTPEGSRAVGSLSQQVRHSIDPHATYVVSWNEAPSIGTISIGVTVDLARRGWRVRVSRSSSHLFGRHWTASPASSRPTLLFLSGFAATTWTRPPGARRVARYDALSRADRRKYQRLDARIRHETGATADVALDAGSPFGVDVLVAQGASRTIVGRFARLQRRGDRYEAWLLPAVRSR